MVYVGETVNFSVNATGTPTMLYQWLKGGIPMGGETNTLLTLVNVQADQAANYRVDVTNRVAYSNSAVAVLTVKVLNMAEGGWIRKPTGGQGTFLRWPAISNRWYEVWWSSNLMLGVEGFVPVNTTLPSVVGANFITYTDSTHAAGGRGFYQIRSRTDP